MKTRVFYCYGYFFRQITLQNHFFFVLLQPLYITITNLNISICRKLLRWELERFLIY